jgi:hypothetical protein
MRATGCAATASFSSRSSRFNVPSGVLTPDPGHYESFEVNTMGAAARSLSRSPSAGAFGGRSGRDLPWQRPADGQGGGSTEDAPLRSSFGGGSARGAAPSAAFAGHGGRFATPRDATPGPGSYSARSPLSPSTRLNRSASFGGRSKRFGSMKEENTPAPGTFDAKPGAFDNATRKPRTNSSGFGSRSTRGSPFAASMEANNAPAPGAYDTHSSGAFAGASSARSPGAGSAAFASRSGRFDRPGTTNANAGPDLNAYSPAAYGSMAQAAGKTFNKHSHRGGGGFGTSARRPDAPSGTNKEATPGPGSYADENDARRAFPKGSSARSASPSAAFRSTTAMHGSYMRKTDAPVGVTYNAHAATGMAAQASKSFNKLAGTGRFGSRAARPLEGPRPGQYDETPAPGSYAASDPTRPTCTAAAHSARSRPSSAFSSTERRDTSKWTGAEREQ